MLCLVKGIPSRDHFAIGLTSMIGEQYVGHLDWKVYLTIGLESLFGEKHIWLFWLLDKNYVGNWTKKFFWGGKYIWQLDCKTYLVKSIFGNWIGSYSW